MKARFRRALWGLAGLALALPLFHLVENVRGSRAWNAARRARAAAGEVLDPVAFAPPAVPDAENFAAAPRIAAAISGKEPLVRAPAKWPDSRVRGWPEGRRYDLFATPGTLTQKELGAWLGEMRAPLDEIAVAARRPSCRIPVAYNAPETADFIPAMLGFRAAGRILQVRALLALQEGRTEDAFQDVATLLRLTRQFRNEPLLILQLLRSTLGRLALQPLWEGLDRHAWTQPQLAALQELADQDLLASLARAWRLEQLLMDPFYQEMADARPWSWSPDPTPFWEDTRKARRQALFQRLLIPRGWRLQSAIRSQAQFREAIIDSLDPVRHRVDPRRQDLGGSRGGRHEGFFSFTVISTEPFADVNLRTARAQAGLDQARIACALERAGRSNGAYPATLAGLGEHLPTDLIDGAPLRYRRTGDGGYVLYSLGWNGVDDGGEPGQEPDPMRRGDWTWIIHGPPSGSQPG